MVADTARPGVLTDRYAEVTRVLNRVLVLNLLVAFAKIALLHFPPFVLVSLRSTLAAAFLVMLLLRRGSNEWRAIGWPDVGMFAFLTQRTVVVSLAFGWIMPYRSDTVRSGSAISGKLGAWPCVSSMSRDQRT